MNDKTYFRKKYKALRAELSQEQLEGWSLDIANRALTLPIWERTYYHIFLTISEKKEIDTQFLLHILQGRDKSIVVPKSDFQTLKLQHYLLQENTRLQTSSYGIPEPVDGILVPPSQLDVVFVPLLAFDRSGARIGYGKGFYDRFLGQCSKDTLLVGLSFFDAEERLPASHLDVPLHFAVTPSQTYVFGE